MRRGEQLLLAAHKAAHAWACPEPVDTDSSDSSDDNDAPKRNTKLSAIGNAAWHVLHTKHYFLWNKAWNISSGKVVGEILQTPKASCWDCDQDLPEGHSDWFPEKLCELISRANYWVDITSLAPPDGLFMEAFQKALLNVANTSNLVGHDKITVRILFGNVVGMPVNVYRVMEDLTALMPDECNVELWVGAWRKNMSWNHSKLIAVDGRYLYTGGHNLWSQHYLRGNPVHDMSVELEGKVAHDGHYFANHMWRFIHKTRNGCAGRIMSRFPGHVPIPWRSRVSVTEYPEGDVDAEPPVYDKAKIPRPPKVRLSVKMISMGRYGAINSIARPSDDALHAMFSKAEKSIRLAVQDIGPICFPHTRTAVPGMLWPKRTLDAFAEAMYERDVHIEIALSTPGSIPGGLGIMEALYGNGWTCADVAAEITKRVKKLYRDADDDTLEDLISSNLHVCYIRQKGTNKWANGLSMGNHTKHFIIDDVCFYVGSQNLYLCDLSEWGVVVDDPAATKKVMEEYWYPMWRNSYQPEDCYIGDVMGGLDVERDGEDVYQATDEELQQAHLRQTKQVGTHKEHFLFEPEEMARHVGASGAHTTSVLRSNLRRVEQRVEERILVPVVTKWQHRGTQIRAPSAVRPCLQPVSGVSFS